MRAKLVRTTAMLSILGLSFMSGATASAAPRQSVAPVTSSSEGFRGTQQELVASLMPQLMAKSGHAVTLADAELSKALQAKFNGRSDFLWSYTMVKTVEPGLAFSISLPAQEAHLRDGRVALGVIKEGKLTNAFTLSMKQSGINGPMTVRLTRPDGTGTDAVRFNLDEKGHIVGSANDLVNLSVEMGITTRLGIVEFVISALEMVVDLLYTVRDVINIAICAVDLLIDLGYTYLGCGMGSTTPGGGAVINQITCSVSATIEVLNELFSRCI